MRNRVTWLLAVVALVMAVGAATIATSEPVEARAPVVIEDTKAELEAALVEGLITEGGDCVICVSPGCPMTTPCGWIGSTKCTCRTCGGSYDCWRKPGWPI